MSTGDVVVCWILALPAVAAFFFAYGVLEGKIKADILLFRCLGTIDRRK
jgi:hypothetical protein